MKKLPEAWEINLKGPEGVSGHGSPTGENSPIAILKTLVTYRVLGWLSRCLPLKMGRMNPRLGVALVRTIKTYKERVSVFKPLCWRTKLRKYRETKIRFTVFAVSPKILRHVLKIHQECNS